LLLVYAGCSVWKARDAAAAGVITKTVAPRDGAFVPVTSGSLTGNWRAAPANTIGARIVIWVRSALRIACTWSRTDSVQAREAPRAFARVGVFVANLI
jgi:hypothetical protein